MVWCHSGLVLWCLITAHQYSYGSWVRDSVKIFFLITFSNHMHWKWSSQLELRRPSITLNSTERRDRVQPSHLPTFLPAVLQFCLQPSFVDYTWLQTDESRQRQTAVQQSSSHNQYCEKLLKGSWDIDLDIGSSRPLILSIHRSIIFYNIEKNIYYYDSSGQIVKVFKWFIGCFHSRQFV